MAYAATASAQGVSRDGLVVPKKRNNPGLPLRGFVTWGPQGVGRPLGAPMRLSATFSETTARSRSIRFVLD